MATTTLEKVTFALPADLMQQVREFVGRGVFPSQNALVREALQHEIKRQREEWIAREYAEAASDPLFLEDMAQTMAAFESSDAQTARMIGEGEKAQTKGKRAK